MHLSQVLTQLMNETGVTAYKISKDTGISNRLIGYWRDGEKLPGAENLLNIANYFNVSVDYLLTGKEAPHNELSSTSDTPITKLSDDEQKLLEDYNNLHEPEKKLALQFVSNLLLAQSPAEPDPVSDPVLPTAATPEQKKRFA